MAQGKKKKLRKTKDKIIHAANDIRDIGTDDKTPGHVRVLLDETRNLLIESTNKLTAAINFTPKE